MSGFEYINTRVLSMRSKLMKVDDIVDMVEAEDAEGVLIRLMNSPYNTTLSELIHATSREEAVDLAFNQCLQQDLKRIMSFAGNEDKAIIKVLVSSWDSQALKSLIRGVRNNVPANDILRGIGPVIDFNDDQLKTLASLPDPQTLISQLATWGSDWAAPLVRQLADYDQGQNIQVLEQALDKHRYTMINTIPSHPEKAMAADFLAQEAELKNIIHALTLIGRDIPPNLLPQPGRSLKLVHDLCEATTQADAMAILTETSYHDIVDKALPMMLMSTGHFAMLERLLDEAILKMARLKALEDPLSIAVPYHFLLLKHNEIMNLRLIANGISSGMQKNALRASLILPGAA